MVENWVQLDMLGMMQQPGAGDGLKQMVEELSKLRGVPVLQIMRMGTTADGTPLPGAEQEQRTRVSPGGGSRRTRSGVRHGRFE